MYVNSEVHVSPSCYAINWLCSIRKSVLNGVLKQMPANLITIQKWVFSTLLRSTSLKRKPQSSFLFLMQNRFDQKNYLEETGRLEEVSFVTESSKRLKSVCRLD